MSTRNPDDKLNAPDPNELDPALDPHYYSRERARHLSEQFGDETCWDSRFSQPDTTAQKARKASEELRNAITSAGADAERPLKFSVRIAGRDITLQIVEQNGKWFCHMPIEVSPQSWEWRRVESDTYDKLIAGITRNLRAGPTIHDLTPEQELELARMCLVKANHPEVLEKYLRYRLGPGIDASTLNDPRFLSVTNELVMFIFRYSEPEYTPEADPYIMRFANGRPLNLPLVKKAFAEYQKQRAQQKAAEPPKVSDEQLEKASDRELSATFAAIRTAYGQQERQRRDWLRLTPEEAIEALRGPE